MFLSFGCCVGDWSLQSLEHLSAPRHPSEGHGSESGPNCACFSSLSSSSVALGWAEGINLSHTFFPMPRQDTQALQMTNSLGEQLLLTGFLSSLIMFRSCFQQGCGRGNDLIITDPD